MMPFSLVDLIAQGSSSINITVSAADLRSVIGEVVRRERAEMEAEKARAAEVATIGREEAAEKLGVHVNTLGRWAKDGYLEPVKIGTKVLYKQSDIDEMLRKKRRKIS